MSRGTPIHSLRIPPDLQAQLDAWIEQSLETRTAGPFTLTSLILTAVQEKLDKRRRSNGPRRRASKAKGPQGKLVCENCRVEMTLNDVGQFTNDPICGWFVQCWDCLCTHGPFSPGPSCKVKDSGTQEGTLIV